LRRRGPAIDTVERALAIYGKPVYVRHEIVHNRYWSKACGKRVPFLSRNSTNPRHRCAVIFSAHGVPKSVPVEAGNRKLLAIDATCPLVTKVHREAEIHFRRGRDIVLIGHEGHPEVTGTMGELPAGAVRLVQLPRSGDVRAEQPDDLAYVTQTTLSVDDTAEIVATLQKRFPTSPVPTRRTSLRHHQSPGAVKRVAPVVDAMIVVGSPNSSNSQRLKEVALRNGCPTRVAAAGRGYRLG